MPTNRPIAKLRLHDKLVLTVPEACALADIGRTKLYEEVNAGRLVAHKRGMRTFITRAELDRYLESSPRKSVVKNQNEEEKLLW